MQQNAKFIRKLPIPMDIKKEFPVTEEVAKVREARVEEMRAILDGRDSRLMLLIGPCSADREDSVMDYVCRLVPLQEKVKDKILIVPRIYTNKPRTNGSGYKGMLHQPDNVAHAQNAIRHAARDEGAELVQLFPLTGKFDGLARHGTHGKGRAPAGIAVQLGQDDARHVHGTVKGLGHIHGLLARGGIRHQERFPRRKKGVQMA